MRENKKSGNMPLANHLIKSEKIQVIAENGDNIGVISRSDALRKATEAELDLVQIADKGGEGYPVAKIMDLGKALYVRKKKQVEAKKHQKIIQIKELKFRPKIGEHDYMTKMNHALQFLKDGKRVKMTLFFRGREMATKEERGRELFEKIEKTFDGFGLENMVRDRDSRAGPFWSRVYYLKS
ncbi:translation initiation factor IF-3 [bacterium]|nr:translation initiation factor IF-3 [bacterium]